MEQQQQQSQAPALLPAISREEFEAMTWQERAVALARDVIAQVQADRLNAEAGTWVEVAGASCGQILEEERAIMAGARCTVCALGALVVSAARHADQLAAFFPAGLGGERDVFGYLRHWLPNEMLEQVEVAFEQGCGAVECWSAYPEIRPEFAAAVSFGSRFEDDDHRLVAIMQNIIDNGGEFRPDAAVVS